MNKFKKIIMVIVLFVPIIFVSGCNCSGGNSNSTTNDTVYSVRFITNNPIDFNIGPIEVMDGDTLIEPKRPSTFKKVHDDGKYYIYSFAGWFQDAELTTPWLFTYEVHSDLDLFAKYSIRAE